MQIQIAGVRTVLLVYCFDVHIFNKKNESIAVYIQWHHRQTEKMTSPVIRVKLKVLLLLIKAIITIFLLYFFLSLLVVYVSQVLLSFSQVTSYNSILSLFLRIEGIVYQSILCYKLLKRH
jgi:hypothetical protein